MYTSVTIYVSSEWKSPEPKELEHFDTLQEPYREWIFKVTDGRQIPMHITHVFQLRRENSSVGVIGVKHLVFFFKSLPGTTGSLRKPPAASENPCALRMSETCVSPSLVMFGISVE